MGFVQCQRGAPHCVRKETFNAKDSNVVEPNQRFVMVAMAIGMIAGALLTRSPKESNDVKAELPVQISANR